MLTLLFAICYQINGSGVFRGKVGNMNQTDVWEIVSASVVLFMNEF